MSSPVTNIQRCTCSAAVNSTAETTPAIPLQPSKYVYVDFNTGNKKSNENMALRHYWIYSTFAQCSAHSRQPCRCITRPGKRGAIDRPHAYHECALHTHVRPKPASETVRLRCAVSAACTLLWPLMPYPTCPNMRLVYQPLHRSDVRQPVFRAHEVKC